MTESPEPSRERRALLETVAGRILESAEGARRRVGIDGVDGAGKTFFARELAGILAGRGVEVVAASVDGFHHPRRLRYRQGRGSSRGFYEDSFDYDSLTRLLLDPFGAAGDGRFVRAIFDVDKDLPIDPVFEQAGPRAILLFDGIFLYRPELRDLWTFSVFLDVDFAISVARMGLRDGTAPEASAQRNKRYVTGQKIYLTQSSPTRHATMVIDNNDLEHPRIIRADR